MDFTLAYNEHHCCVLIREWKLKANFLFLHKYTWETISNVYIAFYFDGRTCIYRPFTHVLCIHIEGDSHINISVFTGCTWKKKNWGKGFFFRKIEEAEIRKPRPPVDGVIQARNINLRVIGSGKNRFR